MFANDSKWSRMDAPESLWRVSNSAAAAYEISRGDDRVPHRGRRHAPTADGLTVGVALCAATSDGRRRLRRSV